MNASLTMRLGLVSEADARREGLSISEVGDETLMARIGEGDREALGRSFPALRAPGAGCHAPYPARPIRSRRPVARLISVPAPQGRSVRLTVQRTQPPTQAVNVEPSS